MARIPRLLPLIAIAIGGVVAVRAVGVAPGLFDGAKAWAEEAAPAVTGAAKPALPGTCAALSPEQLAQQAGISPAELKIIQSLSQRRAALDARDQDFATTLPLMVAAEQKLDAKIQAMTALKAEMKQMLGQVDEREKAEIDRLVQVYSAMRPKEAAPVMATLEDRVRLPVAAAMRPRTLAAIMAQDDACPGARTDRETGRPFPGPADGRPRRRRRGRDPGRRRADRRASPDSGRRRLRRSPIRHAGRSPRDDPGGASDAASGRLASRPAPGDPARASSRRHDAARRDRAAGLSALERRQRPAASDGAVGRAPTTLSVGIRAGRRYHRAFPRPQASRDLRPAS